MSLEQQVKSLLQQHYAESEIVNRIFETTYGITPEEDIMITFCLAYVRLKRQVDAILNNIPRPKKAGLERILKC